MDLLLDKRKLNPLWDLLALAAGAALVLAFAPFNLYLLAIVCPAILLLTIHTHSAKRAAWRGWLFGVGLFSCGIYWVYISIHTFGQAPVWLAFIATALLVSLLALFYGALGYVSRKFIDERCMLLAFPAYWVLLEWARSTVLSGFPWLLLGDSQTTSALRGLAPVATTYGITLACVMTSAWLIGLYTLKTKRNKAISTVFIAFVWLAAFLLTQFNFSQPVGKPFTVSLIQGNIPQEIKWQPEQTDNILKTYKTLTEQHWKSDLIIWPEAAIPSTQHEVENFIRTLHNIAKIYNSTIITGLTVEEGFRYFNGMIMLGDQHGSYLKRKLVPFGEYLPMKRLFSWTPRYFNIPMSGYSEGPHHQHRLLFRDISFAPTICYEIAYHSLLLSDFPEADVILNITDDSWFGDSIAPYQQFQIAKMRALEMARYVLQAANTGVTAIIKPNGTVLKQAPMFKQAVITAEITGMSGITPVMVYSFYPALVMCALLLLMAFAPKLHRHTKKQSG